MKSLIPFAVIVLLLAMAAGRWWVRRSLSLLTVEQKARVMDASSTGNIWPLACLAVGFGIFSWVLPGRIPLPYVFGFLAAFLLTLLLVSAGAGSGQGHSTITGWAAPALCSQHCLRRDTLLRRTTAVDWCGHLRAVSVCSPRAWSAII